MLRMIIADDEFIVRDGLKTMVPWDRFGIEVIGDAEDGQETYELCNELKPDILLTDIRMPFYDGLEVATMLREQNSRIKVIIISGAQDFSYAKTALNINAAAYILKPIKIDELSEAINKVVETIHSEKANEEKLVGMNRQLRENAAVIREKYLRNLVHGVYMEDKEIWGKIHYLSIPFGKNEKLLAAVLKIDDYSAAVEKFKEENRQLLTFSVCNITEEIISSNEAGICFINSENEFVLIFNELSMTDYKYAKICRDIVAALNKYLEVSASIGIGSVKGSLPYINQSYDEASIALQHRFYTGRNTVIDIKEVQLNEDATEYPNLYDAESRLINEMKQGQSVAVTAAVNEIFNNFESNKKPPVEYVRKVCIELVSVTSKVLYELGENMDQIADSRPVIFDTISGMQDLSSLKQYLLTLFVQISDYFCDKFSQKNTRIIGKIKEIINHRYNKDLSISDIAAEVYLSPNYISLIFKQETGVTITEYITGVRMDAAKELLGTTDFKILEVAEMVGYENPHYFSTVFKKYTGIHPQNFRALKSGK